MKVELKNVQSIKHALYEIPDTGIIQIAGGNSMVSQSYSRQLVLL